MVSETIYVELLNEGTSCWRPVQAERLPEGLFRITGPVPDDEEWAFLPGSVVRGEERTFQDGTTALVACDCYLAHTSEIESWLSIAVTLGVEVISPVDLTLNGTPMTFTALLPQFGFAGGMIVDPDYSVIEPHRDALIEAGYGYSCYSIAGTPIHWVQDALREWTWNKSTRKPDWY